MVADRTFRVVVVGAGIAGLFIAEKLKRARIDFTVYERAGEVGGTWRDNTYPGLFVDVLSRQYELDRKSTRLNSSHIQKSRMPSSA